MKIPDIVQAGQQYGKRFQIWLEFILKWECEYNSSGHIRTENVPGDSGGLTFAGVDQASHPKFNYLSPTPESVAKVYFNDYWNPSRASFLDWPVGEVTANFAVNMGRSAAVKLLQSAINQVAGKSLVLVDGIIGEKTIAASKMVDAKELADVIEDLADARYRRIADANPKNRKFLQGWYNRNNALEKWWMNLPHP